MGNWLGEKDRKKSMLLNSKKIWMSMNQFQIYDLIYPLLKKFNIIKNQNQINLQA